MDYPTAWEICRSVPETKHHPDCSWRSGLLCDCEVLVTHPQYIKDYNDQLKWQPVGQWVNGEWVVFRSGD